MGILDIFRGKKTIEQEQRHELTEVDRELSLRQRQINAELKRTQREIEITRAKLELQNLKDELNSMTSNDELDEDAPTSFETALSPYIPQLIPAVVGFLNGKNNANSQPHTAETPSSAIKKIVLSQEQIDDYMKENKKYVKFAKTMTDTQIKEFLLNRVPDLSDESIELIISRVRK